MEQKIINQIQEINTLTAQVANRFVRNIGNSEMNNQDWDDLIEASKVMSEHLADLQSSLIQRGFENTYNQSAD